MMDFLVVLLVVLPPLDWAVALILTGVSRRHPEILTLRERAIAAVVCATAASIAGVLAWSRLGFWEISGRDALLLIAFALTLVSLPALYWLALLVTGHFRIGDKS